MIKVAIIGRNFGKIGLFPAFNSIKGAKVAGIYTKENWRNILKDKTINAIAIATPPDIQYKIAKEAIKNKLHIFAEKPLAVSTKQAKELLTLANKNKITTCMDFIFPEIAEWKKVKYILDSNKLGKLKNVSVDWQWLSGDIKYRRRSWKTNTKKGGGVLSFYFSHGLYYLEYFAGKIQNIETKFTHSKESLNGAEVGIDMSIKFENKVNGSAHIFCNSREYVRHKLVFECEKGAILLENKNAIVDKFTIQIQTKNKRKKILVTKDKGKKGEDERAKIVRILANRFIKACTSGKQMTPSFVEGLRIQELIDKSRK
ncbi:MAG: hypothetical protein QG644_437 [Patescibacteria group bacterium]|nr:hypothetical protein [Patescibacteria group bacterium]